MERDMKEVLSIIPLLPDENGRFIMTMKLNVGVLEELKKCPDKLFLKLTGTGAQLTFDNEIVNLTAQTLMDDESKPVECYEQEENQLIECGRVQNKLVICDDLYSNNVSQNVRNALKEEKQKKNENAIMEWSNGKLLRDHDRPNARREPARKRPNTEQPQPKPEPVAAGNAEELRSHLIHLLAEEGKATSITAIVKKSKGFTPTAINSALHQIGKRSASQYWELKPEVYKTIDLEKISSPKRAEVKRKIEQMLAPPPVVKPPPEPVIAPTPTPIQTSTPTQTPTPTPEKPKFDTIVSPPSYATEKSLPPKSDSIKSPVPMETDSTYEQDPNYEPEPETRARKPKKPSSTTKSTSKSSSKSSRSTKKASSSKTSAPSPATVAQPKESPPPPAPKRRSKTQPSPSKSQSAKGSTTTPTTTVTKSRSSTTRKVRPSTLKKTLKEYEELKKKFEEEYPNYSNYYHLIQSSNTEIQRKEKRWEMAKDRTERDSIAEEIRQFYSIKKEEVAENFVKCTDSHKKLTTIKQSLEELSQTIKMQYQEIIKNEIS